MALLARGAVFDRHVDQLDFRPARPAELPESELRPGDGQRLVRAVGPHLQPPGALVMCSADLNAATSVGLPGLRPEFMPGTESGSSLCRSLCRRYWLRVIPRLARDR